MVFNSSTVGAAKMLQDAMWETIQGTDLVDEYPREKIPGSNVPEEERRRILDVSSKTIDVLNAIIERGLIAGFHNNLVEIRWRYMQGLENFETYRDGWYDRVYSYEP